MHYSDRDVNNAIDEFRAGGDILPPEDLPPEVFAHLTPAQLRRWESALHHEEMRILREWHADWWANGGELPPTGVWHWSTAPDDLSGLDTDDVA
jgi:hypothetical protein